MVQIRKEANCFFLQFFFLELVIKMHSHISIFYFHYSIFTRKDTMTFHKKSFLFKKYVYKKIKSIIYN